jgi:hypothetical protein
MADRTKTGNYAVLRQLLAAGLDVMLGNPAFQPFARHLERTRQGP